MGTPGTRLRLLRALVASLSALWSCGVIVGIDDRTVSVLSDASTSGSPEAGVDAAGRDVGPPGDGAAIDAKNDGTGPSDGSLYPAPHPSLPIITKSAGSVIANPTIMAIMFPGYEFAGDMGALATDLVGAGYWSATLAEYGVGVPSATTVNVSETAPTTIDFNAVGPWLQARLTDDAGELGAPSESTVYTIFFPQTTTVVQNGVSLCSETVFGFNDELDLGGMKLSYAAVLHCPNVGIDYVTTATSGIWLSALTNPHGLTDPAYVGCDAAHFAWWQCQVGSLCTWNTPQGYDPPVVGHSVAFAWSNQAAAASHNPCVPQPTSAPYFASAPVLPDMVSPQGKTAVAGVNIAPGQSKTIDVDLFSDAPTSGPWTVTAREVPLIAGSGNDLTFDFDRATGQNGDVLHLTITVAKNATADPMLFGVYSTLGAVTTGWAGLVGY